MEKLQFRVLYHEFLFRMVDLELLSAHAQGDMSKLLGQFAALLIFLSLFTAVAALQFADSPLPRPTLLVSAWGVEHSSIALTMVVVGLFAVLSWDSTFPDRRDVLVLAPLPVRPRTLFLAKAAASGMAVGLTVAAINALPGLVLPLALSPESSSALDLIFSPARYRLFAAYWITMMASGAFIFCAVLGVQGLAAQFLPRRQFLRASAWMQMAAFCLFLSVYFLQPTLATPRGLNAPEHQRLLAWLPSYWFLGLFQQLNGSMHPAVVSLARRAWIGLGAMSCGTALAYLLSYFRTLKKIVEEPDITPGVRGPHWSPRFGNSLQTAVVQFSVRTLLRSRQHRVTLAFYLGIGFAIMILLMRGGIASRGRLSQQGQIGLMFSSFVIMCVCVVGTRVVFSMPLALRANWVFRLTEVRAPREYVAAVRRPLFVLAVAPVWLAFAAIFLTMSPWRTALEHLAILGVWGLLLAWLGLYGFQKIPFTCSYLPGKSSVHMAFLGALGALLAIQQGVMLEQRALAEPAIFAQMVGALFAAAFLARWRAVRFAKSDEAFVQFEEEDTQAVLVLGLHRDGALPIEP
jgi:hypothetical protein